MNHHPTQHRPSIPSTSLWRKEVASVALPNRRASCPSCASQSVRRWWLSRPMLTRLTLHPSLRRSTHRLPTAHPYRSALLHLSSSTTAVAVTSSTLLVPRILSHLLPPSFFSRPMSTSSPAPTPSPSATPTSSKRSTYTDTALHVLKGAIVSVLGPSAAVTASVKFEHPTKAQLTIVWPEEGPLSQEKISAIERKANDFIRDDLPIKSEVRGRKEAEEFYTAHPVNSTFIYDRFPVPAEVDPLTLCLIEGVNVNCCRGPHTATTGELKALKILKAKKSRQKEKDGSLTPLYEFLFAVHTGAEEAFNKAKEEAGKSMKAGAGGSGASAAPANDSKGGEEEEVDEMKVKAAGAGKGGVGGGAGGGTAGMPAFEKWKPSTRSHIQKEADELLEVLKEKGLSAEVLQALQGDLERRLTMFSNVCYSMGYQAATDVTPVSRSAML